MPVSLPLAVGVDTVTPRSSLIRRAGAARYEAEGIVMTGRMGRQSAYPCLAAGNHTFLDRSNV